MAMPIDGSSSWHHHDDTWTLLTGRSVFARVSASCSGEGCCISIPLEGTPHDAFYVLQVRQSAGTLLLQFDPREQGRPWSQGLRSAQLVPPAFELIYPRTRSGPIAGADPIAALRPSATGAFDLIDPAGRIRVSIHLAADKPQAPAGLQSKVCNNLAIIDLHDHAGCSVQKAASSQP